MALIDEKKEPIIDKNAQEIEKEILKIKLPKILKSFEDEKK